MWIFCRILVLFFITFWYKQNWQLFRLFLRFPRLKCLRRSPASSTKKTKSKKWCLNQIYIPKVLGNWGTGKGPRDPCPLRMCAINVSNLGISSMIVRRASRPRWTWNEQLGSPEAFLNQLAVVNNQLLMWKLTHKVYVLSKLLANEADSPKNIDS